jgi:hypothetical protein
MTRVAKTRCAFCAREPGDGPGEPLRSPRPQYGAEPFEEFEVCPGGFPYLRWLCAFCAAMVRGEQS